MLKKTKERRPNSLGWDLGLGVGDMGLGEAGGGVVPGCYCDDDVEGHEHYAF